MRDFDSYYTDDSVYEHCECCENKFNREEADEQQVDFGYPLCPHCYEDRVGTCERCGTEVRIDDLLDGVCEACLENEAETEDESE